MHVTLRDGLLTLVFMSAITGKTATAQDILASTGVSTRSYNYAEIQYLTNVDQSNPFLVTGLVDLTRGFALKGQYTNQREKLISDSADLTGDARTDLFTLGVLYHNRLRGFSDTDWFAEVAAGRLQLQVDTPLVKITQGVLIGQVAAGIRHTLTERIELEVSVDAVHAKATSVTNSSTDLTVSAIGIYRVMRNFDIALSINEVPSTNILGIGLRFTW